MRYYTYKGVRDTLRGHANRLGLNLLTVRGRVKKYGISRSSLIFAPVKPGPIPPFADPKGRIDTISGHARRLGMSRDGFRYRYKKYEAGLTSLEQLFDPHFRQEQDTSWQNHIAHGGITDTYAGWARRIGISYASFHQRVSRNKGRKNAEERIFCPRYQQPTSVLVTYKGETRTLAEWARRIGMSEPGLARRLKCGATPAQALAKTDWRHPERELVAQPAHGNHTRRKLAALGIFA